MRSLNFNESYEQFMINNDPNRVIRFNPADPDIIQRIQKLYKEVRDQTSHTGDAPLTPAGEVDTSALGQEELESKLDQAAACLATINGAIRDGLNEIFNADVYTAAFAGQSPLCVVTGKDGDPKYLFEVFLEAILEVVGEAAAEYRAQSEKRMSKYTERYHK